MPTSPGTGASSSSGTALVIGAASAVVASILIWLIAVITNHAFYGKFSAVFRSPSEHHLGWAVVRVRHDPHGEREDEAFAAA